VGHLRGAVLLAFWVCLLFFPEHPAADALLASLAVASAAISLFPLIVGPAAWPYAAYLVLLTIAWRVHPSEASTQEYLRQLCFLSTVFAVAQGARGATRRWVGIVIIGLALVIVQILGPHSVVDALGRPLHYRSIQQWSGYPEIGLLATLGAIAALAFALVERSWRVRAASAFLALGFVVATMYLLSRFSLFTIVLSGVWVAIVAAVSLRRRTALVVLAACLLGGAGLMVMRGDFSARLHAAFVDRTAAVEIRAEGWRVAKAMLAEHPVFGVGPGRYREEYPRYSSKGDSAHAYNIILHEAAEIGYLGVIAYLAMWARVLWRTFRAANATVAAGAARVAGAATSASAAISAAAALATHGMLVAFFLRSQSEHFLANLGASFRVLLLLAFVFGLAESLSARRPGEA
jgi:O-antigen ligase